MKTAALSAKYLVQETLTKSGKLDNLRELEFYLMPDSLDDLVFPEYIAIISDSPIHQLIPLKGTP